MAPTFTLTGDISQVHDPSITKIAVGRSTSPQGPFADQSGTPMLQGGGTILLESGTNWTAPGGATVLIDPVHGDLIAYHALKVSENYQTYLFVDALT
jgi:arabinan endo-1,5-alpha-L-arabinosidase